jgi:type II secretory pathway predicted ATPase ExeA
MLLPYFKLTHQPFGVTPDPAFLYMSPTHREAAASLEHAIRSGRGFSALIASPGMGKTTLLFDILHQLKGIAKTAFLFQPDCTPAEFLGALLADLGVQHQQTSICGMQFALNEFLCRESNEGGQVVIVVDEAQNLDRDVLELIRTLSNFETPNKKLIHVILAGQPQLAETLASDDLLQLRQRISIIARLAPLSPEETAAYIAYRLQVAGYPAGAPLFSADACEKIARHSQGIPRNINNLCFNAMSLACAMRRTSIDTSVLDEVIDDLDLSTLSPVSTPKVSTPKVSTPKASTPEAAHGSFTPTPIWRPVFTWRKEILSATAILLALAYPLHLIREAPRSLFFSQSSAGNSPDQLDFSSAAVSAPSIGAAPSAQPTPTALVVRTQVHQRPQPAKHVPVQQFHIDSSSFLTSGEPVPVQPAPQGPNQ